tara:strand:- start:487 stop:1530 length:1044 start_codon:yes stop_codon:yes gene_type:complete
MVRHEILDAFRNAKMTESDIKKLTQFLSKNALHGLVNNQQKCLNFSIHLVRSWVKSQVRSLNKSDYLIALFSLQIFDSSPELLEDNSILDRIDSVFFMLTRLRDGMKITKPNHDFSQYILQVMSQMHCHIANTVWLFSPQLMSGCGCVDFVDQYYMIAISTLSVEQSLESDIPVLLFHELLHAMSHYVRSQSRYLTSLIDNLYKICELSINRLDRDKSLPIAQHSYWSQVLVDHYKHGRLEEIMIRLLEKMHFHQSHLEMRLAKLPLYHRHYIDILISASTLFKQVVVIGHQWLLDRSEKSRTLNARVGSPISIAQVESESFPLPVDTLNVISSEDRESIQALSCRW